MGDGVPGRFVRVEAEDEAGALGFVLRAINAVNKSCKRPLWDRLPDGSKAVPHD